MPLINSKSTFETASGTASETTLRRPFGGHLELEEEEEPLDFSFEEDGGEAFKEVLKVLWKASQEQVQKEDLAWILDDDDEEEG